MRTLELDRVEQFARLDAQVGHVAAAGESLRAQTASLAGALRSSNTRGAWGEVQLRRVVELAGMLHRVDFETQVSGVTPDGAGVRPDLLVRLPGGKQLVVDAKAPLSAFLDAYAAGATDEHRDERLRAHARALRGHVDALAARDYSRAFAPTPELVVCFVPGESMLAAALDADSGTARARPGPRASSWPGRARCSRCCAPSPSPGSRRPWPATPASCSRWAASSTRGSARLGGHSAKLGRTLHRAVEDYNALVGTLERRVLVTARRISELDLAREPLPEVLPLEVTTRPLTATELLDDLGDLDLDRRPELLDESPARSTQVRERRERRP